MAGASSAAVCASPAAAVGRARASAVQKSAEFDALFLVLYVGMRVFRVCSAHPALSSTRWYAWCSVCMCLKCLPDWVSTSSSTGGCHVLRVVCFITV